MADLAGLAVLHIAHRLRGSDTLKVLAAMRGEPWHSPEATDARQLARARALVRHCAEHVPYYRRRFRELGIAAEGIRGWDDFARLPVLTKQDVAAHGEELIAENRPRGSLLAHYSGGSTGVPLRFYRDRSYLTASEAGTYRNLEQCGWRPGELIAFFWGWNDRLTAMPRLEFVARQLARRMYQFDPFRSGERELDDWWRTWRWLRPRVALGYASTIARFARHLETRGYRPRPLKGVFTTAEKLFPAQRALLERVFACRVFDCYGSSEVQNIATECPHGSMHVNADYAVVESDPSTGAGAPSPLLVTSLLNYAMPFLRYRNEDTGRLVSGACSCGRGFPLMSLDVARVSDNFRLPDGRVVHGEFFTHLLYGSSGIDSFQFHQVSAGRIVLRYVRASSGDPEPALDSARARIEELAPGLVEVQLEAVPAIALSSAGKHRFTRSDVA